MDQNTGHIDDTTRGRAVVGVIGRFFVADGVIWSAIVLKITA
jgi:hypothetical protein